MRNQPGVFENNFHAMKKGHLTEAEAQVAETIFFRRVQTRNMHAEVDVLRANARVVADLGKPNVPFHAFISGEQPEELWRDSIASYAASTGGRHQSHKEARYAYHRHHVEKGGDQRVLLGTLA